MESIADRNLTHHIKHCEEEEKIVEGLLYFLAEDRDEGDEVATETDQGHGQEQDSLQQEGQHAVESIIFPLQHTLKLQTPKNGQTPSTIRNRN